QLTAMGLVEVDPAFNTLRLGPDTRPAFRGERKITFRRDRPRKATEAKRARQAAADLPETAQALFDALRAERARPAKEQGVPPYVVFHDTTLRAMAVERPASLAALGTISGVGESKLKRYGAAFLAVISGHA